VYTISPGLSITLGMVGMTNFVLTDGWAFDVNGDVDGVRSNGLRYIFDIR
jgi:hypothetical protein